jgi:bacillithiol system protein YtxJ
MSSGWIHLEDESQFTKILSSSFSKPVVLFKHSTRCATSSMAYNRLADLVKSPSADVEFYFLDLIKFRKISNKVSDDLGVYHESPQVLLLKNGECVYDASHYEIRPKELESQISVFA